ncbi:MAG: hypothetical protein Q7U92_01930, partial [Bradyrhizobium sp.]|nr:hypothetical protein [Bradyrhizobium sp.]
MLAAAKYKAPLGQTVSASEKHQFPIFGNKSQALFLIIGIAIFPNIGKDRAIRKGCTMLDVELIERGLEKPGKTKGGLASAMGVRPGAVSEILSGIR